MEKDNKIDGKNINKYSTIFYWVSGISLFISIIALCGAYFSKNIVVEDESIVLLFVGFLTTFIVVSNYSQVKSIEQDFSQKVGELKHEFAEKVKELTHEFDRKVLLSQTISIMKELYKKMVDSTNIAEELIYQPFRSDKHKELIERGKEYTNEYINLLNINRFILPDDVFPLFKELEYLLSDCFNNIIYSPSTPENNIKEEERISGKLNNAVIKDIPEIQKKIDELIIKYLRHE